MSRFIKGMDLSTLLELERCGAKYYDHGKERDILDIMRDYDVDTIRLRLWNDPYSETGEPYGAGCNDLAETIAIGKKVSDAGFGVLLNFHYSDFWADPGKQYPPKEWAYADAVCSIAYGAVGFISCYALASKLLCILSTFTVSSLASGIPLFAFPHASL